MLQHHVPVFAVDLQYLVAGVALSVGVQQILLWRRDRANVLALWIGASAVVMACALGSSIWLFKAPRDQIPLAVFVRTALLIVACVVQIPVVAALAGRPTPWRALTALSALGAFQLLLVPTTDLVYRHQLAPSGQPVHGPWRVWVVSVLLASLVLIMVRLVRQWHDRVEQRTFVVAFAAGIGIISAALSLGASPMAELLSAYWILAIFAALEVIFLRRMLIADADARRTAERLRASEERFRALVASSADMIAIFDERFGLMYANPAAERLLGWSPEQHVGDSLLDLVHPAERDRAELAFGRLVAAGGGDPPEEPQVWRLRSATGRWRHLGITARNCLGEPAIRGVVMNARDETEATSLGRALRTTGGVGSVLVQAGDESTLLADTCATIVEAGGYPLAWVGCVEEGEPPTLRRVAAAGTVDDLAATHRERTAAWVEALESRPGEPLVTTSGVERLPAVCVLPLALEGRLIAALAIYSAEDGAFRSSETDLLASLAASLAYGIGRLRDAEALAGSEQRWRVLSEMAPIGILEMHRGQIRYANERAREIVGKPGHSMLDVGWMDAVHPDDRSALFAQILQTQAQSAEFRGTFRMLRPDGETRHVRFQTRPQEAGPFLVTLEDCTDEVTAREQLVRNAFYDELTGLPNRALLLDRLAQDLRVHSRDGSRLAVLFVELDGLKKVSDSLGHDAEEAVLREVAARLAELLRPADTLARLVGDQFVVVVQDAHRAEDAVATAQTVLAAVPRPILGGDTEIVMSACIGIALPEPGDEPAAVVRNAGLAMHEAKQRGPGHWEVFSPDLHRASVERFALESELRGAVERGELELHYQPIVDLATGEIIGPESLVRWHHPTRGLVPPLQFIPVAEETGLIQPIGLWVLEEAARQLAAWDAAEGGCDLQVGVNLSPLQFEDPDLAGTIIDVLARNGLEPGRLVVEITESAAMSQSPTVRRTLESFSALGLRVAIDDFGTGYSSLAHLQSLPISIIKIDRAFVERVTDAGAGAAVVGGIVEMGHAMGLRVLAEGVSEPEMLKAVTELGCDSGQGYLWSRPLPADEFVRWWREARSRTAVA